MSHRQVIYNRESSTSAKICLYMQFDISSVLSNILGVWAAKSAGKIDGNDNDEIGLYCATRTVMKYM